MKTRFCLSLAMAALLGTVPAKADLSELQRLGKNIFFDPSLSEPAGQACASCHDPAVGYTNSDSARNARDGVAAGAVSGRAGSRTPPSVAYAILSPPLHWNHREKTYEGGEFRDGRASDILEQVKFPLTNPLEMNNPDGASVCRKVAAAPYGSGFAAFGGPLDCSADGFDRVAEAIAAYEGSSEVNAFSSKYDAYLAGRASLDPAELRGLALYRGKAKCERCHPSRPGPQGEAPLFTDFGYDNIGVPRNPANPFYRQAPIYNPAGAAYVDPGLGAVVEKPSELGKFKVPTLRNVAAGPPGFTRAYMHNGALKGLKAVMNFYNDRDRNPSRWPPEEARNINRDDLGDLKLTPREIDDVIAFLRTLTDGWQPPVSSKNEAQRGPDLLKIEP